ncbi:MAG: hypothetical protein ACJA2S_002120 [Cyclobacteriaceae bacterium]|jgi:hypothetical protein
MIKSPYLSCLNNVETSLQLRKTLESPHYLQCEDSYVALRNDKTPKGSAYPKVIKGLELFEAMNNLSHSPSRNIVETSLLHKRL